MIPHQFGYLFGDLALAVIWLILFFMRKDLRSEMVFASVLLGVLNIPTSYLWWTVDWWRPLTVTGTLIGIEDVLLGVTGGGIAAVVYEELIGKRYRKSKKKLHQPGFLSIFSIGILVIGCSIWIFHLGSPVSSSLGMIVSAVVMLYYRPDLLPNALFSGILLEILSLPFYSVVIYLSPGWVDITYLKTLSGFRVMGIPIEEIIFWFLLGFVMGPMYEYWKGEKLKA